MVLRSFSNLTKCKGRSFSFSRKASARPSHLKFFNPSYTSPNELVDASFNAQRNSGSGGKKSAFKYVAPGLAVTKNYVVVADPNNYNNENDLEEDKRIVLKKCSSVGNKNSHINLKVESKTDTHTTINIRRSNSSTVKKIVLQNNNQATRNYSTTHQIENDLSNLKIADEEVKSKQINDSLDEFLYTKEQGDPDSMVIDNLISLRKTNEVLPVFHRMRNNNVIPSIDIYNKVLKSIGLRTTDESSEIKLTHLLNTYSDMLSNGLKPDQLTYELVIEPLLKGSMESFQSNNFQNGYDFFKIALELFLISQNNSSIKFQNNGIYSYLVKGLIYYRVIDVIKPEQLFEQFKDKIDKEHQIEFYLSIIQFAALFKNSKFVNEVYSLIQSLPNSEIYSKQNSIYLTIIESLNLCGEFDSSYKILEQVISKHDNEINKETQSLISKYLSLYLKSQASLDPFSAFKTLYNLNLKTWLPDVSVGSLLYLTAMFLQINNLQMANKVWDFAIIRKDFDSSFKKLNKTENHYYPLMSLVFDQYAELSLISNDRNQILKCTREMLIKKSLSLNDSTLVKLLNYLQSIEAYDLSVKIVLDQGAKREKYLNNYLSTVVDSLNSNQYVPIVQSKFFKNAVEQYRLINDNIYGIMKMLTNLPSSAFNEEQFKLKISYYSKVLDYEFNDLDNCYVKLPHDLVNFKSRFIANWC